MNIKAVQEYSHVQCVCVFSIALTTIHLQSQSRWYLHYLRIQKVKYLRYLRIQNLKVLLSETSFRWYLKELWIDWRLFHSALLQSRPSFQLKRFNDRDSKVVCLCFQMTNDTYFLMANHFRFQKVVFYWLKPVPRPAVCFVEFLCCGKKAKRPRIEALKLQMCVMVIRPLFAPILMTDLIPVFKRPTESRRYMETDILDNICVDYFYSFFP